MMPRYAQLHRLPDLEIFLCFEARLRCQVTRRPRSTLQELEKSIADTPDLELGEDC
jgi:hypothetical protein